MKLAAGFDISVFDRPGDVVDLGGGLECAQFLILFEQPGLDTLPQQLPGCRHVPMILGVFQATNGFLQAVQNCGMQLTFYRRCLYAQSSDWAVERRLQYRKEFGTVLLCNDA